jgi:hypothetical protein
MVLLNASSKARNAARIITQNQGGGSKKAGFPYMIGRGSWSNIYLGPTPGASRSVTCCKRIDLTVPITNRTAPRSIGRMIGPAYNHLTGVQQR